MSIPVDSRHRRTVRGSALFTWALFAQNTGHRHEGQGLAEYGLIIVLVAIAAITTLTAFGQNIVVAYYEAIVAGLPF